MYNYVLIILTDLLLFAHVTVALMNARKEVKLQTVYIAIIVQRYEFKNQLSRIQPGQMKCVAK